MIAATAAHWNFPGGLPYPTRGWIGCPVCQCAHAPRLRWWKFHVRRRATVTPYRCDVSFKCTQCAFVWFHGVALTAEQWAARPYPGRDGATVAWRHGKKLVLP